MPAWWRMWFAVIRSWSRERNSGDRDMVGEDVVYCGQIVEKRVDLRRLGHGGIS
jgi:hypothetical protein